MEKILMYDKYDETYREVIDVKELREYILKKIEEYKKQIEKMEKDDIGVGFTLGKEWSDLKAKIDVLQSFLEDLEVEDD